MKGELKMDVNDYLPLRDVVFNTLRQAILRGEMEQVKGLWKFNSPISLE